MDQAGCGRRVHCYRGADSDRKILEPRRLTSILGYSGIVFRVDSCDFADRLLIKLIETYGLFPSLWEGLGEGAKLDAHQPSPQPLPKGEEKNTLSVALRLRLKFVCST